MRRTIVTLALCLLIAPVSSRSQVYDASGKVVRVTGLRASPLRGINLRAGPRRTSDSLAALTPATCLLILEDRGSWLRVQICGTRRQGFVYRPNVSTPADGVVNRLLRDEPALKAGNLEPGQVRAIGQTATPQVRTAAEIWNRYGGLLERVSAEVGIEPAAAIAVIAAESRGSAFHGSHPVIRFENHVFWDLWGERNPVVFARFFRFRRDPPRTLGHEYRTTPDGQWKSFHNQQAQEWSALQFASRFDRRSAYRSASWGLTQILGVHHGTVGYSNVDSMVARFSDPQTGVRWQILAFFDFIRGRLRNSTAVMALRNRDWVSFAQVYNGFGLEAQYSKALSEYYDAARVVLGR